MIGSRLRLLPWVLPVVVAVGFVLHLHRSPPNTHPSNTGMPKAAATHAHAADLAPPDKSDEGDSEALARLRDEIAQLRTRVAQRERDLRARLTAASEQPATRPPLTEAFLTPEQWRDAGEANPADLMETLLWAGAGGDLARLSELLVYTPEATAAAESLWQKLPEEFRRGDASAESLIALLATDAVPLKPVTLAGDFPQESGEHIVVLQVDTDPDAPGNRHMDRLRFVKLTARQNAAGSGWQIVVTPAAIDQLARRLDLSNGEPPTP